MSEPTVTLLLVDDEPSILSALRRLFRPQGYRILLAESGAAALTMLATEPVDLVLSDMRMPGMDGATLLEQVRQRWPQTLRMLLTGYADISSTIAAINRGEIHRYIAKPWDDQDLVLSVREGLTRRALELENQRLLALTRSQNEELQQANSQLEHRVHARTAELEQVNNMLQMAYAQLDENFLLSLDVFAGLMELRERGAAGHSREVARLAKGIAQQLGLPPREVRDVFAAGLLHEIGKMSLPDTMLHKPLSLMSSDEQTRWRRHPLAAQTALLPLAQLQRVAQLVRAQLERLDGKGGPDGLQGEDFAPAAQALAVAVRYMGLIHGRMSEKACDASAAQALIAGGAGTHFSAAVVQAFAGVMATQAETPPAQDVCIDAQALRPGMVLARDLHSASGVLLLAAGFRFDAQVVRQIHEFVAREGSRLKLHVHPTSQMAAEGLSAERLPESVR
ncbi:MAG: response regulator [Proteobacteria bacterium]|nr:response regulator [Pseudomonadota bacterium]